MLRILGMRLIEQTTGYRIGTVYLASTDPGGGGRIPNFPCHVEAGMKDGFAMVFSKFQRPALK
jgi:hypothetical protein